MIKHGLKSNKKHLICKRAALKGGYGVAIAADTLPETASACGRISYQNGREDGVALVVSSSFIAIYFPPSHSLVNMPMTIRLETSTGVDGFSRCMAHSSRRLVECRGRACQRKCRIRCIDQWWHGHGHGHG